MSEGERRVRADAMGACVYGRAVESDEMHDRERDEDDRANETASEGANERTKKNAYPYILPLACSLT